MPVWAGILVSFVVGVLVGRWSRAMRAVASGHASVHSQHEQSVTQNVQVVVGDGAGIVDGGALGGSRSSGVRGDAPDRVHGWLSDREAIGDGFDGSYWVGGDVALDRSGDSQDREMVTRELIRGGSDRGDYVGSRAVYRDRREDFQQVTARRRRFNRFSKGGEK